MFNEVEVPLENFKQAKLALLSFRLIERAKDSFDSVFLERKRIHINDPC